MNKLAKIKTSGKVAPVAPIIDESAGDSVVEPEGQVVAGLDPRYGNLEYSRPADNLINTIKHQIVVVEARPYTKEEVLNTATKILEGRL